ncbi:metal-dependent transcriptional regulator [Cryomorphaceae bacterium]|nr:metal-dependent transcriptional regulator [Cryomorphaceae bacterium]
MHSTSEENYLKAIYTLSEHRTKTVSTKAIADRLETQSSSVTDMVKRLSEKGLVNYQRYQGVELSDIGFEYALQIIRKHRLWETFLVEKLGFGWDEVHDMAEQLEHIQSTELTERLDAFLGHPSHDPHGDPIPNAQGEMETQNPSMLDEMKVGFSLRVVGVRDSSSEFLQYLDGVGISLGTHLEVLEIVPFDQSMSLRLDGGSAQSVSRLVAQNLYVKRV